MVIFLDALTAVMFFPGEETSFTARPLQFSDVLHLIEGRNVTFAYSALTPEERIPGEEKRFKQLRDLLRKHNYVDFGITELANFRFGDYYILIPQNLGHLEMCRFIQLIISE